MTEYVHKLEELLETAHREKAALVNDAQTDNETIAALTVDRRDLQAALARASGSDTDAPTPTPLVFVTTSTACTLTLTDAAEHGPDMVLEKGTLVHVASIDDESDDVGVTVNGVRGTLRRADVDSAGSVLHRLSRDNAAMKSALSKHLQSAADQEKNVRKLRTECEAAQNENKALRAREVDAGKVQSALDALRTDHEQVKQQLQGFARLQATHAALQVEADRFREQAQEMRQLQAAHEALTAEHARLQEDRSATAHVQAAYDALQRSHADLKTESEILPTLRQDARDRDAAYAALQAEHEALRTQHRQLLDLPAAYKALQAENHRMRAHMEDMTANAVAAAAHSGTRPADRHNHVPPGAVVGPGASAAAPWERTVRDTLAVAIQDNWAMHDAIGYVRGM